MRTHSTALSPLDQIESMLVSNAGHLRAADSPPKSITNYADSIRSLINVLRVSGMPPEPAEIGRTHTRTHMMRACRH